MPTRACVQGFIEKRGGNFLEMVFNKDCQNLKEILEAVESALEEGAYTVILKRVQTVKKLGRVKQG